MGTASIDEGIRRMRFSDLLDRTEAKELTQEAASEILGISARQMRRWKRRYEEYGYDGLYDRRRQRPSRVLGMFSSLGVKVPCPT